MDKDVKVVKVDAIKRQSYHNFIQHEKRVLELNL